MNKIQELKQKYPQYATMPDAELADKLYNKYYTDMDRKEFDLRMGVKPLKYGPIDELTQNATIGLADEVGAAGSALGQGFGNLLQGKLTNIPESYSNFLEDNRLRRNIYREQNPKTAFAAGMAGGATVAGPTYANLATKYGPIVSGVATGGTMGGVQGFNEGEGGFSNRMKSSVVGGSIGAALGGVIPAAILGGKKAISLIKNALGWVDVPDAALQRTLKAMNDDGLTPDEILSNLQKAADEGVPMSIADQGENLQSLGSYVSKQPGQGRTTAQSFVKNRQAGQFDRIVNSIRKYISGDDMYKSVDDLINQRRTAAKPLYESAYNKDFISSDTLDEIMSRDVMQKAYKKAANMIKIKGGNPEKLGFKFDPDGNVKFTDSPSMEALDYIKRSLDDLVNKNVNKVTGKPTGTGLAYKELRDNFKSELIKLNPDYGKALKAYSDPSQSLEIIAEGKNYTKRSPQEIETYIKNLSPNDMEFYRIGVAQQMIDNAAKAKHGANKALGLIGSPQKERALKAVFGGDENLQKMVDLLDAEAKMHQTYTKVIGGSPTQPLQAEGDALSSLGVAQNVARGDYLGAAGSLLRNTSERLKGVNDQTAANISGLLFEDNPLAVIRNAQALKSGQGYAEEASRAMMAKLGLLSMPPALQIPSLLDERQNRN